MKTNESGTARATAQPNNLQPAEGAARAALAARELAEREAEGHGPTPSADALPSFAPPAPPRDPAADAADAAAVARAVLLSFVWFVAKRRPGRVTSDELRDRRRRVDSRAQRVGARLGPRLGTLLGDWLLFAGLTCEASSEALEDAIDELGRLPAPPAEASEK